MTWRNDLRSINRRCEWTLTWEQTVRHSEPTLRVGTDAESPYLSDRLVCKKQNKKQIISMENRADAGTIVHQFTLYAKVHSPMLTVY